jgi:hypothetical protein
LYINAFARLAKADCYVWPVIKGQDPLNANLVFIILQKISVNYLFIESHLSVDAVRWLADRVQN